MIDYEKLVKELDSFTYIENEIHTVTLDETWCVFLYGKVIGTGETESEAWESAYNYLTS